MNRICFGLLLVCGHLVTGVAVAQEIRVRLVDIESGKPAKYQPLHLSIEKGKEVRSKPGAPPSLVPTGSVSDSSTGTDADGIAHFDPPGPVPRLSREISLIKFYTNITAYPKANESRYVSCAAGDVLLRAEEVLKAGAILKNMNLWCSDKKARDEVKATPGEIVMFVRSLTGMPSKEIRVRVIDIETGKPAKDVDMDLSLAIGGENRPGVPESLGIRYTASNSRLRVPTPRDGVVRYNVPAELSEKAGEIGLIRVSSAGFPSNKRYVSCDYGQIFRIDEVLKHGVTVKKISPWCPDTKALDEVNAAPGEIVTFVRSWTWRERIRHFFSDS
jgi:hypothetical protein